MIDHAYEDAVQIERRRLRVATWKKITDGMQQSCTTELLRQAAHTRAMDLKDRGRARVDVSGELSRVIGHPESTHNGRI
jgi:hypothetical protein